MRLLDFLQVFFIFLIFGMLLFYNMYSVGIKKVKDNWGEYKCKPSVMPFAKFFGHDPSKNFSECIQAMQTDYLMKEELVSGTFGIEGRYPYLDKDFVQEFLWLIPKLKNKDYKYILSEYMKKNNYPFYHKKKEGFRANWKI